MRNIKYKQSADHPVSGCPQKLAHENAKVVGLPRRQAEQQGETSLESDLQATIHGLALMQLI